MRARILAWWFAAACAVACFIAACATALTTPEGPDGGDASCANCSGDAHTPGPDGGCAQGEIACYVDGGKPICADTKTDPNHCGTCTNACLPTLEACDGGVCVSNCGAKTLCIFDAGTSDAGDDAGDGGPTVPPPHCADLQNDTND